VVDVWAPPKPGAPTRPVPSSVRYRPLIDEPGGMVAHGRRGHPSGSGRDRCARSTAQMQEAGSALAFPGTADEVGRAQLQSPAALSNRSRWGGATEAPPHRRGVRRSRSV